MAIIIVHHSLDGSTLDGETRCAKSYDCLGHVTNFQTFNGVDIFMAFTGFVFLIRPNSIILELPHTIGKGSIQPEHGHGLISQFRFYTNMVLIKSCKENYICVSTGTSTSKNIHSHGTISPHSPVEV